MPCWKRASFPDPAAASRRRWEAGFGWLFRFLLVSVLLHVHGGLCLNETCYPTDLEALLAFSNGLETGRAPGLSDGGPETEPTALGQPQQWPRVFKGNRTGPELRTLNLARNKLVGEIPLSFKDLRSLSYLSLSGNGLTNLSSALQVLQHLPNPMMLVFTKNFRGGETMPVDGISGFKSMQVLVLANCLLSGIIPPWLQSLENLSVLDDISRNKLNRNIPPWIRNLNNLFYIDLSNNSFSGELPESFTRMRSWISVNGSRDDSSNEDHPLFVIKNNSTLRLQYNQFSSFPPSLVLSNNLLVGPVSASFGPIPDELSNMSSLEMLNLAHNDLNGTIPSSLAKLNFLSMFDVSYNNLAGDIPTGGQFSTFSDEDFEANPALCPLWNSSCHRVLESEIEQL
ncbi:hypothetical protein ACP4OV_006896 [Aristida adscensionis]